MNSRLGNLGYSLVLVLLMLVFLTAGALIFWVFRGHQAQSTRPPVSLPFATPPVVPTIGAKPQASAPGSARCDCSWTLSVSAGNVKMLVTDPNGDQTGFDPSTNSDLLNIPDSSYSLQELPRDDVTASPPAAAYLQFAQNDPKAGIYLLRIIGQGTENYDIDLSIASTSPSYDKKLSIKGMLHPGEVDRYSIMVPDGILRRLTN